MKTPCSDSIPVLRDKNERDAIVSIIVGYSDKDIEVLLKKHPSWYRSTLVI